MSLPAGSSGSEPASCCPPTTGEPAKPTRVLLPAGNGHRHCTCCKIQPRICGWYFKTRKQRFWLPSLGLIAQRNSLNVTVLGTCAVHGGRQQVRVPGEHQQPAAHSPELGMQRHSLTRVATSCQAPRSIYPRIKKSIRQQYSNTGNHMPRLPLLPCLPPRCSLGTPSNVPKHPQCQTPQLQQVAAPAASFQPTVALGAGREAGAAGA